MKPRDAFFGVFGAGLLAACAAAGPPASVMRQSPQGPEPTTIEEAQADIARWRDVLVPGAGSGTATSSAPKNPGVAPGPPTTPTTPEARPQPTTPDTPRPSEAAAESRTHTEDSSERISTDGAGSACVTPCRAIASMRRSVTALCRLSGEDDTRCLDARKTLADSEKRVASCGC